MPPIRRKTSQPTSHAQKTLAFGPNTAKITKPSLSSTTTKKSIKPASSEPLAKAITTELSTPSPAPEDALLEPKQEESKGLAIRGQQDIVKEKKKEKETKNKADLKAEKIPEAQIKRYWRSKEEERIAPRVHQRGLSTNEKILRHFDLSSQYGPCIGISRVRRWKRAQGLGLKPPIEVLAVLAREEGMGNEKAERAFMDGLLTSRVEA